MALTSVAIGWVWIKLWDAWSTLSNLGTLYSCCLLQSLQIYVPVMCFGEHLINFGDNSRFFSEKCFIAYVKVFLSYRFWERHILWAVSSSRWGLSRGPADPSRHKQGRSRISAHRRLSVQSKIIHRNVLILCLYRTRCPCRLENSWNTFKVFHP